MNLFWKWLTIILGTDLLTFVIWCEYKYKKHDPLIIDKFKNNLSDLYLICIKKIPWEFDPQRENPNNKPNFSIFIWKKSEYRELNLKLLKEVSQKDLLKKKNITKYYNVKLIYNFTKLIRGCCKKLRLYPFSVI